MTVQREDIEPESQRAISGDWRRDPSFRFPDKLPWSVLRQYMIPAWGRDEQDRTDPEHEEIVGPTGSGKTWLMATQLRDRMVMRKSPAVIVATKPTDGTLGRLGWPIIDNPDQLDDEPNAIFWPHTKRMGLERRAYHESKISDLLHRLWVPESNRIVAFDEVGYVESLSGQMRALVQQYWRESRSQGITVVAMKQRPQGALRDMHSETFWTAVFPPKDRSDTERFAELLGAKRDWVPVIDSLSVERREFVIRHARTGDAFISWVDTPLTAAKPKRQAPKWWGGGRGEPS